MKAKWTLMYNDNIVRITKYKAAKKLANILIKNEGIRTAEILDYQNQVIYSAEK